MSLPAPIIPYQPVAQRRWKRLAIKTIAIGGWLSLVVAVGVWLLLRAGDLWTPATLLMFGPRWPVLIAPLVLLPAALVLKRRALGTILPALVVAAGPLMGFSVPWGALEVDPPANTRLRMMTCNMHYTKGDIASLNHLIDSDHPDVVALQQWRDSAASRVLTGPEWHTHRAPELFLASRFPIVHVESLGVESTDERGLVMRYDLETPSGTLAVFSLHFATPRDGLKAIAHAATGGWAEISANSERRWSQSRHVAAASARVDGPVLIVGDFNTPPQSAIFREVWGEYTDAFSSAGWGWGFTFFSRWAGVRIDHILAGPGGRALRSWVGPDVGSLHRPLLADVSWTSNRSARD